jgi:mono/diheme cytochrome c family protein
MKMPFLAAVIVAVGAGGSALADAIPDPGHVLYLRYCGACHGPDGRGDGIAAPLMTPPPPDLTRIAERKGGTFPFAATMKYIDGTATVRAHGLADMPVWGERFSVDAAAPASRHAEVRGKLLLITEFVQSIQAE